MSGLMIAHIEPTAARFAFVKMLCLGQWRSVRRYRTARGLLMALRQPQRELPIGARVAINEIPKIFRNVMTIDIAAALDFESDIS
jgi:hypothetical protein